MTTERMTFGCRAAACAGVMLALAGGARAEVDPHARATADALAAYLIHEVEWGLITTDDELAGVQAEIDAAAIAGGFTVGQTAWDILAGRVVRFLGEGGLDAGPGGGPNDRPNDFTLDDLLEQADGRDFDDAVFDFHLRGSGACDGTACPPDTMTVEAHFAIAFSATRSCIPVPVMAGPIDPVTGESCLLDCTWEVQILEWIGIKKVCYEGPAPCTGLTDTCSVVIDYLAVMDADEGNCDDCDIDPAVINCDDLHVPSIVAPIALQPVPLQDAVCTGDWPALTQYFASASVPLPPGVGVLADPFGRDPTKCTAPICNNMSIDLGCSQQ